MGWEVGMVGLVGRKVGWEVGGWVREGLYVVVGRYFFYVCDFVFVLVGFVLGFLFCIVFFF